MGNSAGDTGWPDVAAASGDVSGVVELEDVAVWPSPRARDRWPPSFDDHGTRRFRFVVGVDAMPSLE
jgi:hypothetical protein